MTFNPLSSPIDYIVLAGKRSPGVAEINSASSPREWDERKGYGVSGSFSIFMRRGLAKFTVTLTLTDDQDWADWAEWKPIVDRVPKRRLGRGPDSGYLEIQHPILADLDIKAVGVTEVGQPVQTDHGLWQITIGFIEWRRPVIGLAKPEAAKAAEVDPVELEIELKTRERDTLAALAGE